MSQRPQESFLACVDVFQQEFVQQIEGHIDKHTWTKRQNFWFHGAFKLIHINIENQVLKISLVNLLQLSFSHISVMFVWH